MRPVPWSFLLGCNHKSNPALWTRIKPTKAYHIWTQSVWQCASELLPLTITNLGNGRPPWIWRKWILNHFPPPFLGDLISEMHAWNCRLSLLNLAKTTYESLKFSHPKNVTFPHGKFGRKHRHTGTRNTFCGRWYLPHNQVHNDRTVRIITVILRIFHYAWAKRPYFHFRCKIWRHHRVPRSRFPIRRDSDPQN